MIKTIKTNDILAAFTVLSTAKYSAMDDNGKVKVWKIARVLKPIANKFKEDSEDAAKTLKPEVEGGYDETLAKAQEFVRMQEANEDMSKAPMIQAEFDAFDKVYGDYQKLIIDALTEFSEKDVEVEFEPLDEDAFSKLVASNDWQINQAFALEEIICE